MKLTIARKEQGAGSLESIGLAHPTDPAETGDVGLILGGASGEDVLAMLLTVTGSPDPTSLPDTIQSGDGGGQWDKAVQAYPGGAVPKGAAFDSIAHVPGYTSSVAPAFDFQEAYFLTDIPGFFSVQPCAFMYDGKIFVIDGPESLVFHINSTGRTEKLQDEPSGNYPAAGMRTVSGGAYIHAIGGGFTENVNHYMLNLLTKSWLGPLADLPAAREIGCIFENPLNNRIMFAGGVDNLNARRTEVWEYDHDLDSWAAKNPLSVGIFGGTVLPDPINQGQLLMFAQDASWQLVIQRYNPATDGWSAIHQAGLYDTSYIPPVWYDDSKGVFYIGDAYDNGVYVYDPVLNTVTPYYNILALTSFGDGMAVGLGNGVAVSFDDYVGDNFKVIYPQTIFTITKD